jgi:hypothetical protein
MKTATIKRMKRLIELTEYVYQERAREVVESRDHQALVAETLEATRGQFGSYSLVEAAFPELLARRAARLGRELGEADHVLEQRIEVAAASRANVKGLEGKLQRMVTQDEQQRSSVAIEDAIDSFLRKRGTRLR